MTIVDVQQCDREAAAEWYAQTGNEVAAYRCLHPVTPTGGGLVQAFARYRHRLAALASAPAEKGLKQMTEAINSTQRLRAIFEKNPEQLHFTLPRIVVQMLLQDSEMLGQERLARSQAASAPAGDGVIEQARRMAADLVIADGGQHDRAKRILGGSHDEGPTVQAFAAALARPRAAVGERKA